MITPLFNCVPIVGRPPSDYDLAIVPTDLYGTPGKLNSMVFQELGYRESDLREANLKNGYHLLMQRDKVPVLLIVTIGMGTVAQALGQNLGRGLLNIGEILHDKNIWIPLMGTGDGNLDLNESLDITIDAINEVFQKLPPFTVSLSFPANERGKNTANELDHLIRERFRLDTRSEDYLVYSEDAKVFSVQLNGLVYVLGISSSAKGEISFSRKNEMLTIRPLTIASRLLAKIKKGDILLMPNFIGENSASGGLQLARIRRINAPDQVFLDTLITDIPKKALAVQKVFFRNLRASEIATLVTAIPENEWQKLLSKTKNITIPGLISDTDTNSGTDYLSIDNDVTAFAKVISAKSFRPPLAIALQGEWGSGKSFFMKKLKEQIEYFSQNHLDNTYCSGVVHIHFNAWSYMDANLWASLVTQIFDGLNNYIVDNTHSDKEKDAVRQKLTQELTMTRHEIDIYESKLNAIGQQIKVLESTKLDLNNTIKSKIATIRKSTIFDLVKQIDAQFHVADKVEVALKENNSFIETTENLKKIVPERYWDHPENAYQEAKSSYTFLKVFFDKENIFKNLTWLIFILALIIFVPPGLALLTGRLAAFDFTISQGTLAVLTLIGATWKRAENAFNKLRPVIKSFWDIKKSHEARIREAEEKFAQEEKALKLEIEKTTEELLVIDRQIQESTVLKAGLEFKIKNAIASETLYAFIEKRSQSDDYKKHLGLLSHIRKDFEILNDLFSEHQTEAGKKEVYEDMRKFFKKPLDRIILYIDDLDRCPEKNVVQVLEAVNLLMAFPLFVVVAGVDTRWITNALVKQHELQFGVTSGDGSKAHIQLKPADYLEKIFQVPFTLKNADDTAVKNMLRSLAGIVPQDSNPQLQTESTENFLPDEQQREVKQNKKSRRAEQSNVQTSTNSANKDTINSLIISEQEIILIEAISPMIGNNPRSLKRFVNILRIVKAHSDFDIDVETHENAFKLVLLLLSFSVGPYKAICKPLLDYNRRNINDGSFQSFLLTSGNETLKKDIEQILHTETFEALLPMSSQQMLPHHEFVVRFSFAI